jgi:D-alanyl-D-alanine carboxypeptidase
MKMVRAGIVIVFLIVLSAVFLTNMDRFSRWLDFTASGADISTDSAPGELRRGRSEPSSADSDSDGSSDSSSIGAYASTLLVNADNALPSDFPEVELIELYGKVPVYNTSIVVSTAIAEPLEEMFDAAIAAGHTDIFVSSGYRSAEKQAQLYEEAEDKSFVQPAGHSEHQSGLAVDISVMNLNTGMGETQAGRWLAQNSWKYGFILRYPPDKAYITGISYEPWHFRYVGKKAAKICYDEDLCWEEYIASYVNID